LKNRYDLNPKPAASPQNAAKGRGVSYKNDMSKIAVFLENASIVSEKLGLMS
jgi:hypothetical protein